MNWFDLETQQHYDIVTKKLSDFYRSKGFIEVHLQSDLSILAACEDPSTVATFEFSGQKWPMKQTNQMGEEVFLLKNPNIPGVFCNSTSYRDEKNPIPGRHLKTFPMNEFELKGNMDDLRKFEVEMLTYLGFNPDKFVYENYNVMTKLFGVDELTSEHETKIGEEISNVFFLEHFNEGSNPYFNMRRNTIDPALPQHLQTARKIDVILHGIETIGSAEREVDPVVMMDRFMTISDGQYSQTLFDKFGKDRVMKELNEFLSLDFFERSGGGIGISRLIRAMKLEGLL